jgi:hypothetical protein
MLCGKYFGGILLVLALMGSISASAIESNSPIGIGLFPPLQVPNSEFGITGLRVSGVGINRASIGLDVGLLGNITNQTFNYNKLNADIIGFQIAGLANVNGTGSSLYGIQLGLFNKVTYAYGLQIGLINVAQNLHGIQIGLINFNDSGPFKISPLINASF